MLYHIRHAVEPFNTADRHPIILPLQDLVRTKTSFVNGTPTIYEPANTGPVFPQSSRPSRAGEGAMPASQVSARFILAHGLAYVAAKHPTNVRHATTEENDLVIIGGGVAGYVAAIKAGQEGLKVCCAIPYPPSFADVIPVITRYRAGPPLLTRRPRHRLPVLRSEVPSVVPVSTSDASPQNRFSTTPTYITKSSMTPKTVVSRSAMSSSTFRP